VWDRTVRNITDLCLLENRNIFAKGAGQTKSRVAH
jgi:hypothetical protein